MSKERNPRRVAENEAMAKTRLLRVSPQKLNLVAAMIRGKRVNSAQAELAFSKRRIAQDVLKTLNSAVANAEQNHGLEVDSLVVAEAWVGKNMVLKRGRPRGRGRYGRILKPFAEITIKVREHAENDVEAEAPPPGAADAAASGEAGQQATRQEAV